MDEKDSILLSVKKMLGLEAEITAFDSDIIMNINSAIFKLRQFGVGPLEGYMITDETQSYDELLINENMMQSVKMYLYLNTKLGFDPPSSSTVLKSYEQQIMEMETRFLYLGSELKGGENE